MATSLRLAEPDAARLARLTRDGRVPISDVVAAALDVLDAAPDRDARLDAAEDAARARSAGAARVGSRARWAPSGHVETPIKQGVLRNRHGASK